jgi:hypothetical protein
MISKNLEISRENAIAAYDNTDDAGRKLLEHLFGKEVFTKGIKERVKTFEDACNVLGDEHPLVKEYWGVVNVDLDITQDLIAYLKLRIITAALNEGWEPQFTEDECRHYPWFEFFTQSELNAMSEDEKGRVVGRASSNSFAYVGLAYAGAYFPSSYPFFDFGSRLAFKTRELAEYAGRQFVELYADFVFAVKA